MPNLFLWKSSARARRRADRARVKARAARLEIARYPGPGPALDHLRWQDRRGNWRHGVDTWSEVRELRARRSRSADHLAACSCAMCGNPRRHWGERSLQERRAEHSDADQQIDLVEFQRHTKRRR